MNVWIVFQRLERFKEEISKTEIKAPTGTSVYHWNNMDMIKKGDILFHMSEQKIKAVSLLNGEFDFINSDKYKLKRQFYKPFILEKMLDLNSYRNELAEHSNYTHAPFNYKGTGNQGYLLKSKKA